MKDELKVERRSLYFSCVRLAERLLPARIFCSILEPYTFARAALNTAFKDPNPRAPWPDCLPLKWTWRVACQRRMSHYLNFYLQYFPERLSDPKWSKNFRIVGLDRLLEVRQGGRPVVGALCHVGPLLFLRPWLRAAGVHSGVLIAGKSTDPVDQARRKSGLLDCPHIPPRFHLDQLKQAAEFLASGNLLFVAIDVPTGRQMEVPYSEGWTFRMATGAIRLAIRHQAELIPCMIIDEGSWRFRIEVGRPVPKEFLTAESDWTCAGKHLLAEMRPHFEAHPEQCQDDLIMSLQKTASAKHFSCSNRLSPD